MARHDRLAIARSAIEILVPLLRSHGKYHHGGIGGPSRWTLEWRGLNVSLVCQVLLLAGDATQSAWLDIWPTKGQKALSVSWVPSQPWLPQRVVSFRASKWLIELTRVQNDRDPTPVRWPSMRPTCS